MLEYIKEDIRKFYESWCDVEDVTLKDTSEIVVTELEIDGIRKLQLSFRVDYSVIARSKFEVFPDSRVYRNFKMYVIPQNFNAFVYVRDLSNDIQTTNRPTDSSTCLSE